MSVGGICLNDPGSGKRKDEQVWDEEPLIPGDHVVPHGVAQQLCYHQSLKV